MKASELLSRLDRLPYLKLPARYLISVLQIIRDYEPNRDRISKEIRDLLFPGKDIKSVVRGMALNDTRRLHLARSDGREKVWLAPNGRFALADERFTTRRLSVVLRDYAVLQLGLFRQDFDVASWPRRFKGTVNERAKRFRGLLEHFDVQLPSFTKAFDRRLDCLFRVAPEYSHIIEEAKRRNLFESSLIPRRLYDLDSARWRIMEKLLAEGIEVSSFAVDRLIMLERRAGDSVLSLWEGATHDLSELLIDRKSYQGLILSE
ncbi:MAG: hypothetical protein KAW09_08100 [Thermoplasmata archaeon]|nr:hypothetical protein [Thermoplasmata archaeon]